MNVALRLLMRGGASALSRAPVRTKYGTGNSTSLTVTFDEGTALDSTYLLVCLISGTTNNALSATGWVNQQSSQALGNASAWIFSRQGNGSVNSITITNASAVTLNVTLVAFAGFVSATKLGGAAGADSTTTMDINPGTPAGTGVAVFQAMNASGSFTTPWTNGWTLFQPDVGRSSCAWVPYTGSSVATSASRTTASGLYATCIFDLV